MENRRTVNNHYSAMGDFQYNEKKIAEIASHNYASYVRSVKKLQSRVDNDLSAVRAVLKQLTDRIEYMEEDQIIRRELFTEFYLLEENVAHHSTEINKLQEIVDHQIDEYETRSEELQKLIDSFDRYKN